MQKKPLLTSVALGVGSVAGYWAARNMALTRRAEQAASLRGQTVLITGGSRGLGLGIACRFAEEGCQLILVARHEDELQAAAHLLRQRYGAEVLTLVCDLTDKVQVEAMVSSAMMRFEQIDILVNNAGIITVGPLADTSAEAFAAAMQSNFWATLHTTYAVLPAMRQRRAGRIVNITSVGGVVSVPHLLPYSTAKFAACGFSQGLQAELAGSGVAVTTIIPGLMRTGSHIQAEFVGKRYAEFAWFSVAAAMPLLSMSTERAARQIVEAAKLRLPVRVLGWSARLALGLQGLFPEASATARGLVNQLLPKPSCPAAIRPERGEDLVNEQGMSPVLRGLTALNTAAMKRYQHRDLVTPQS